MCTLLRHSEAERCEFDMTLALLDEEPRANEPPDWIDIRQLNCHKSLLRSLSAVRDLVAELQPHATLSFLARSNFANVANAKAPCIISERANTRAHFNTGARGLVSRATVRLLYPRATKIIAVSEGVAAGLHENFNIPSEKLVAIANPVDIEALQAKASAPLTIDVGEPYILGVGRFVPAKNFDLLIRAFAASGDPRKLVIAGDGAGREALEALARQCGVADRVLFPGFIANPYPLMRGADVFVLSSSNEGFPNALVESMALGVPVISTNCNCGPSEILAETAQHQISGLTRAAFGVLTPSEEIAPMAEAIRMMKDAATRAAYGEKGRERAKHFSAASAKDKYWTVIREVIDRNGKRQTGAAPSRSSS
jgi:N-acetylgalactosamine-N,N'-diacetylbacillosaminyl-diphospho-undecaprenol 4-alpha-N-acetylgalactosaminyltransferase